MLSNLKKSSKSKSKQNVFTNSNANLGYFDTFQDYDNTVNHYSQISNFDNSKSNLENNYFYRKTTTNTNNNYDNFDNQWDKKPHHILNDKYQTNNNDNIDNYYQSTISKNSSVSSSSSTIKYNNGSDYSFRRNTYNLGKPVKYNEMSKTIKYNEKNKNDSQSSHVIKSINTTTSTHPLPSSSSTFNNMKESSSRPYRKSSINNERSSSNLEIYQLIAKLDSHPPSYSTPRVFNSLSRNFKMSEFSSNSSKSIGADGLHDNEESDLMSTVLNAGMNDSDDSEDEPLYYYQKKNKQRSKEPSSVLSSSNSQSSNQFYRNDFYSSNSSLSTNVSNSNNSIKNNQSQKSKQTNTSNSGANPRISRSQPNITLPSSSNATKAYDSMLKNQKGNTTSSTPSGNFNNIQELQPLNRLKNKTASGNNLPYSLSNYQISISSEKKSSYDGIIPQPPSKQLLPVPVIVNKRNQSLGCGNMFNKGNSATPSKNYDRQSYLRFNNKDRSSSTMESKNNELNAVNSTKASPDLKQQNAGSLSPQLKLLRHASNSPVLKHQSITGLTQLSVAQEKALPPSPLNKRSSLIGSPPYNNQKPLPIPVVNQSPLQSTITLDNSLIENDTLVNQVSTVTMIPSPEENSNKTTRSHSSSSSSSPEKISNKTTRSHSSSSSSKKRSSINSIKTFISKLDDFTAKLKNSDPFPSSSSSSVKSSSNKTHNSVSSSPVFVNAAIINDKIISPIPSSPRSSPHLTNLYSNMQNQAQVPTPVTKSIGSSSPNLSPKIRSNSLIMKDQESQQLRSSSNLISSSTELSSSSPKIPLSSSPVISQSPKIPSSPVISQSPKIPSSPLISQSPKIPSSPLISQSPKISSSPLISQSPKTPSTTPVISQSPKKPSSSPVISQSSKLGPLIIQSPKMNSSQLTSPDITSPKLNSPIVATTMVNSPRLIEISRNNDYRMSLSSTTPYNLMNSSSFSVQSKSPHSSPKASVTSVPSSESDSQTNQNNTYPISKRISSLNIEQQLLEQLNEQIENGSNSKKLSKYDEFYALPSTLPRTSNQFNSDNSSTLPRTFKPFNSDNSSTLPRTFNQFISDNSYTLPRTFKPFNSDNSSTLPKTSNQFNSDNSSLNMSVENKFSAVGTPASSLISTSTQDETKKNKNSFTLERTRHIHINRNNLNNEKNKIIENKVMELDPIMNAQFYTINSSNINSNKINKEEKLGINNLTLLNSGRYINHTKNRSSPVDFLRQPNNRLNADIVLLDGNKNNKNDNGSQEGLSHEGNHHSKRYTTGYENKYVEEKSRKLDNDDIEVKQFYMKSYRKLNSNELCYLQEVSYKQLKQNFPESSGFIKKDVLKALQQKAKTKGGAAQKWWTYWKKEPKNSSSNSVFKIPLNASIENDSKIIESSADEENPMRLPVVVFRCCEHLKKYGLMKEGIFRVNGNERRIQALVKKFEEKRYFENCFENCSVFDVAGLLKLYIRELPDSLFPNEIYVPLLKYYETYRDENSRIKIIQLFLMMIPRNYLILLEYLFGLFTKVTEYSEYNRMDSSNMAKIFAPNLLKQAPNSEPSLRDFEITTSIVKFIIDHDNEFRISRNNEIMFKILGNSDFNYKNIKAKKNNIRIPFVNLNLFSDSEETDDERNPREIVTLSRGTPKLNSNSDNNNTKISSYLDEKPGSKNIINNIISSKIKPLKTAFNAVGIPLTPPHSPSTSTHTAIQPNTLLPLNAGNGSHTSFSVLRSNNNISTNSTTTSNDIINKDEDDVEFDSNKFSIPNDIKEGMTNISDTKVQDDDDYSNSDAKSDDIRHRKSVRQHDSVNYYDSSIQRRDNINIKQFSTIQRQRNEVFQRHNSRTINRKNTIEENESSNHSPSNDFTIERNSSYSKTKHLQPVSEI